MDRDRLIEEALRHLGAGKIEPAVLLPVLGALAQPGEGEAGPPSLGDLARALGDRQGPEFDRLRGRLQQLRLQQVGRVYDARRAGSPVPDDCQRDLNDLPLDVALGWRTQVGRLKRVAEALTLLRDRLFLASRAEQAPLAVVLVEQAFTHALSRLRRTPTPWGVLPVSRLALEAAASGVRLPGPVGEDAAAAREAAEAALDRYPDSPLPEDLDEDLLLEALGQRFAKADEADKLRWLDLILCWPTDRAGPLILEVSQAPWVQQRAALLLKLRFGGSRINTWAARKQWLQDQQQVLLQAARPLAGQAPELLLLWALTRPQPDAALVAALEQSCGENAPPLDADAFLDRWVEQIDPAEASLLLDLPVLSAAPDAPVVAEPAPEPAPAPEPEPEPEPAAAPVLELRAASPRPTPRPVPIARQPPPPRVAPIWQTHLRGFFSENGYLFIGILMVLVGASLTAFFTWDSGWLWRYTLMPVLLGGFTFALAGLGQVLERRDPRLVGTGAVLRGAAICLLPANFMAVALLAGDPDVPQKQLAIAAYGSLYLLLFGWGLFRWCRQVHPRIGWMMSTSLLALNFLVLLGPLAELLGQRDFALRLTLGWGFHLGFLIAGATVIWFSRAVLTEALANERRVTVFVGATLGVTLLEVFVWVHGSTGQLPRVQTYAAMLVLAGGLVLLMEQRILALRGRSTQHLEVSFLGFALILLGVLMGFGEPWMRIACLLLGGLIWVLQAVPRKQPLHHAIGLTLICLGVASIGLLPGFPRSWLPSLGLVLALGLALLADRERPAQGDAARGLLAVVLMFTTLTALVAQWRFDTPPLITAAHLLVMAGLLGWRARREQSLIWVHGAMLMLALCLPYLGCVELRSARPRGNTMAFGLSLISICWLLGIRASSNELLRSARSTVLWFYGGLALSAMILRVLFEGGPAADAGWQRLLIDYSGPLLMAVVLFVTTYHSRSLVPAGMAMLILIIVFPELKAQFKQTFDRLAFGSGLGSACSALAMGLLCFPLRRWKRLEALGPGDLYLGRTPFPLRRFDHTLFTLPLVVSVIFLIVRTESWTLLQNMAKHDGGLVGVKTALALALTGVSWTLMAIYLRKDRRAVVATHLGWFWLLVGVSFAYMKLAPQARWPVPCLLLLGLMSLLYGFYQFVLVPRAPWAEALLARPTHQVLAHGSLAVTLFVAFELLGGGTLAAPMWQLLVLLAALLVWHGLSTGEPIHGMALCALALVCVLAEKLPGVGALTERLRFDPGLRLVLWATVAIAMLQGALEFWHERSVGLYRPFSAFVALVSLACGLVAGVGLLQGGSLTLLDQLILIALLLRVGRDNASGLPMVVACLLAYLAAHHRLLEGEPFLDGRLLILAVPWRLAMFALLMAAAGTGHELFWDRRQIRYGGPAPLPWMAAPIVPWLCLPAAAIACFAVVGQSAWGPWRGEPIQLLAPYLGLLTLGLIGLLWRAPVFLGGAVAMLSLGNVHSVRLLGGESLIERGLSEPHLICLGLGGSLILTALLGRLEALRDISRQACLTLAGLVLGLLWTNYFTHPDLASIPAFRFLVSSAMFLLTAFYFRQLARTSEGGGQPYEGLYHMGVAMALACLALTIPALRRPETALAALGLPALFFYARAELARDTDAGGLWRDSAGALTFVILAMYACFAVVQLVSFPEAPLRFRPYHTNAPLIILLSLVMLRLHGLGGTEWLAFYGGLALMAGSFFAVTALPGLSPYGHPVPAAWCALLIAHFWTVASAERSPMRSWVQAAGRIDGQTWLRLRRSWGLSLLVAAEAAVCWGIADHARAPLMVAPLLVGGASLLIHHGLRRGAPSYFALAGLQLLLALHAGLFVESYLPGRLVIWAVLALWAGMLVLHQALLKRFVMQGMGRVSLALLALSGAHLLYHSPGSATGLWAAALISLLCALVPRRGRTAANLDELLWAAVLLGAPTWLVWFSQAPSGLEALGDRWAWICLAVSLLATGALSLLYQRFAHAAYEQLERYPPRLIDQTLSWMGQSGERIFGTLLWPAAVLALALQFGWSEEPSRAIFLLLSLLQAGLTVAWIEQGMRRGPGPTRSYASVMLQLSFFSLVLLIRGELQRRVGWSAHHDVYALLGISLGMTGLIQAAPSRAREIRKPLLISYCLLPLLTIWLTQSQGLSSNVTLLVVGLHSVMFSYLGREDRQSPYRAVGLIGGVAFVLIAFSTKLRLTEVYAYVIPVGVGVLILLHMFEDRIEVESRNTIRLITLLSMLSSTAYYVLLDQRISLVYNASLMLLCVASMGLGSFLRIRLYVMLGFCGIVVNLATIVVKVLLSVDHTARMTSLGVFVLLAGIGLVGGAVYFKANRDQINSQLDLWRGKFSAWE